MKKLILLCLSTALLSGCTDKDKYKQAVLEQMQSEQDVKDYHIDPQHITDCIVDLTADKMPGLFPLDPDRMIAYREYTQMLTLTHSKDPKKTLQDLRASFGSPKALADAHANYMESTMNCMAAIIMESDDETKDKK